MAEPVAIMDSRDHEQMVRLGDTDWYADWCRANLPAKPSMCYRVEVTPESDGTIWGYFYAEDERGKVVPDPDRPTWPMKHPDNPISLPLKSLPPALLNERTSVDREGWYTCDLVRDS